MERSFLMHVACALQKEGGGRRPCILTAGLELRVVREVVYPSPPLLQVLVTGQGQKLDELVVG